jgi:1-deoxy-D-xylulose-5-phosphate synthase
MIIEHIDSPADLRTLSAEDLAVLAAEIREFIVNSVTATGGHLGSNLGAVELTLALHRTFDSPRDVILWDTGHQAYVHKLVTGRRDDFPRLRQAGGLSGYPNRTESEHDWVENSHASTALSYAHGLAKAFELQGVERRVVAVVGDGALTGGMAYEALNNLGHSGTPVLIVLNDNGRSYAPTVSRLSVSLTHLRLNPTYVQARQRIRHLIRELPGVGELAYSGVHGLTSAVREVVTPHTFFEALGVRYAGPIDGHDIAEVEQALANATEWDGPILLHVVTQKGRGYAPAEEDDVQRLHDVKVKSVAAAPPKEPPDTVPTGTPETVTIPPTTFTDAFTRSLLEHAEADPSLVAITAAMPGPTGLLPFEARYPERFIDVGIAEQHAVTAAAGMSMGGLHPVVAVYSTFFSRAFDQANLDVGLHGCPVVFVLDRAGITGDDGPSHHGVLDLVLALSIPGMTVFAPSSAPEVGAMLDEALELEGPSVIRFPKTPAPVVAGGEVGSGLRARRLREGDGSVCILAVGKLVATAVEAAGKLEAEGIDATVWDVRVVSPPDPEMLADAARHGQVLTAEDGMRQGGAGMFLADAMRRAVVDGDAGDGTLLHRQPPPVTVLGVDRVFIPQDKPDRILARFGLDADGLVRSARGAVGAPVLPVADASD